MPLLYNPSAKQGMEAKNRAGHKISPETMHLNTTSRSSTITSQEHETFYPWLFCILIVRLCVFQMQAYYFPCTTLIRPMPIEMKGVTFVIFAP